MTTSVGVGAESSGLFAFLFCNKTVMWGRGVPTTQNAQNNNSAENNVN